jgi:hypothetical protein
VSMRERAAERRSRRCFAANERLSLAAGYRVSVGDMVSRPGHHPASMRSHSKSSLAFMDGVGGHKIIRQAVMQRFMSLTHRSTGDQEEELTFCDG